MTCDSKPFCDDRAERIEYLEKAHAEAIDEWARLEGLLKAFVTRVEELAFEMRPPNAYTPQFVQLAQYVRNEIHKTAAFQST